jgi:inorganic pyrophosphatase
MPVLPGAVLPARPMGVLRMRDEAGPDERILVPLSRITPLWERVQTYRDGAEIDLQRIAHFFEHYKTSGSSSMAGASPRRRIN